MAIKTLDPRMINTATGQALTVVGNISATGAIDKFDFPLN